MFFCWRVEFLDRFIFIVLKLQLEKFLESLFEVQDKVDIIYVNIQFFESCEGSVEDVELFQLDMNINFDFRIVFCVFNVIVSVVIVEVYENRFFEGRYIFNGGDEEWVDLFFVISATGITGKNRFMRNGVFWFYFSTLFLGNLSFDEFLFVDDLEEDLEVFV